MLLTNREKELCDIMFSSIPWGTAAKVSSELQLSERTIETYLSNIYKKNNVNTKEDLYKLWKDSPDKGYSYTESLQEIILTKSKDIYTVGSDKEFFFVAGLVYRHMQFIREDLYETGTFKTMEDILRVGYTEQNIKSLIKKAYLLAADKLSLKDSVSPLMGALLVYNLDKSQFPDADLIFYAGIFSYQHFIKKLKNI